MGVDRLAVDVPLAAGVLYAPRLGGVPALLLLVLRACECTAAMPDTAAEAGFKPEAAEAGWVAPPRADRE